MFTDGGLTQASVITKALSELSISYQNSIIQPYKIFVLDFTTTPGLPGVQDNQVYANLEPKREQFKYAVEAQTSLAPLSWFHGSRVTTAHAHQCCVFQSYAKTVPSRMKLTMKMTMREPASMTTDT